MSFNEDFGHAFVHAWAAAQKQGVVGGSGSGGRRGGRGGGGGDRGAIHKNPKSRCYKCRSSEHVIKDCPHKDGSRRQVRKQLQEALSAQEALPALAEQPASLPPRPTVAPSALPVITAREPASAWYVDVPSRDPTQSDISSAPTPAPAPAYAQQQQMATELEMLSSEQRAIEERLIEIRRRRQQLLQQLQVNTEPAVKEEEQDQD